MTDTALIDRNALSNFVTRFRDAMERVDLNAMAMSFRFFPRGACGDTSLLLGTALKENGLGTFRQVCGHKSEGRTFESHSWLQAGNLIVDITADQFEGMSPVCVGEDNGWHGSWCDVIDMGEGDFRQCEGYSAALEGSYRHVMSKLI